MAKIPFVFLSDVTGEQTCNCVMCGVDVFEKQMPYAIEKAMKRLEDKQVITLYEMLICMPCGMKMHEKLSLHSRQMMETFFAENKIVEKRSELEKSGWEDKWDKKCLFTDEAITDSSEYNIIGHFIMGDFLPNQPPFIMGEKVMKTLQENLSPETKEELDNFRDQYLGPSDPTLRALLKDATFVLV